MKEKHAEQRITAVDKFAFSNVCEGLQQAA